MRELIIAGAVVTPPCGLSPDIDNVQSAAARGHYIPRSNLQPMAVESVHICGTVLRQGPCDFPEAPLQDGALQEKPLITTHFL